MLSVDFDPNRRLVITQSTGLLSVAEVHAYGRALPLMVAEANRVCGRMLHLVLAIDAVIQTKEVIDAFMEFDTHARGERDRMAVVVGSTLAKMQAERNLWPPRERAFIDERVAVEWLLSD